MMSYKEIVLYELYFILNGNWIVKKKNKKKNYY